MTSWMGESENQCWEHDIWLTGPAVPLNKTAMPYMHVTVWSSWGRRAKRAPRWTVRVDDYVGKRTLFVPAWTSHGRLERLKVRTLSQPWTRRWYDRWAEEWLEMYAAGIAAMTSTRRAARQMCLSIGRPSRDRHAALEKRLCAEWRLAQTTLVEDCRRLWWWGCGETTKDCLCFVFVLDDDGGIGRWTGGNKTKVSFSICGSKETTRMDQCRTTIRKQFESWRCNRRTSHLASFRSFLH